MKAATFVSALTRDDQEEEGVVVGEEEEVMEVVAEEEDMVVDVTVDMEATGIEEAMAEGTETKGEEVAVEAATGATGVTLGIVCLFYRVNFD